MSRIIEVGLVGFGLSGRYFHGPFLTVNPYFNVKKVMTRNAQAVHDFDKNIAVTDRFDDIIQDSTIEWVFVCTPNHLHCTYACRAMEAGKHVVIEKPFANNQKEAEILIETAQKHNRLLTAYQNRRWDADFLTIQKLISNQSLGDVLAYEAYFDRYRPDVLHGTWKEIVEPGSGNLYNLGPHLIDQALVLFGAPHRVSATVKTIRQGAITDDFFDITLSYDQLSVRLHSSLMAHQSDLRYKIHGTKGSFLKNGIDIQEETLRKNILPNTADWGQEPPSIWGNLYTSGQPTQTIQSEAGNYMPFYQNLYDATEGGEPLLVQPTEAWWTTRVIDLAFESTLTQQSLPF